MNKINPEPLKGKKLNSNYKSIIDGRYKDLEYYVNVDIKKAVEWLIIEDVKIKKKISKLMQNIDPGTALKISALLQRLTDNKEKAFEDVY